MPRARQIKPGFFLNEELASVSPLGRLLFAGLWTVADREGRLEDRPNKLRAAVLPYDRADGEKLIAQLAERGFLVRYEIEGRRYLQIVNFTQHQRPHPKEPDSEIPAPLESESRDRTMTSRVEGESLHGETGTSRALPSEISSPSGDIDIPTRARKPRATQVDDGFIEEMVARHSDIPADRVREEIADALGHTAAGKRTDLRAYVRVWLSRTSWTAPQGRNGRQPATYASAHGQARGSDVWDGIVHRE